MEGSSFQKRRAHSDYIHYVPDVQLSLLKSGLVDLDVEAKMKNLAIDKMKADFLINVHN
jgi:hypothetical protein